MYNFIGRERNLAFSAMLKTHGSDSRLPRQDVLERRVLHPTKGVYVMTNLDYFFTLM